MHDPPTAARADLDIVASRIVDAPARGDEASPDVAMFVLREYAASPSDEAAERVGAVLASALEAAETCSDIATGAAWLMLLCDAVPFADDPRLSTSAVELAGRFRAAWPGDASTALRFAACAASVDASLRAARAFEQWSFVQAAVDELERLVGSTYRPGARLGSAAFQADEAALLAAHAACASALLTAFEITARVPYAMLAEELVQPLRHPPDACGVAVAAAGTRVLCRLAALHEDAAYRAAAVVAPDVDYRGDAARILRSHSAVAQAGRLTDAACYGIALRELIALR